MECALRKIAPPSICSLPKITPSNFQLHRDLGLGFLRHRTHQNDAAVLGSSHSSKPWATPCTVGDVQKRSSLESLFCYDKPIPEEIIETPVGISMAEKVVGDNPRCQSCEAKGAILCTTCSGSGLYVDSIMESQGIIVKVRCLGCGGTGNTMCSECGGRGHI